ncbi:MAG: septum formation family protein [Galbitalea sp.]
MRQIGRGRRRGNLGAGIALALLVVPPAVVVWLVLWHFGFASSIVGWAVALGAVSLFKRGSGGVISARGAWAVSLLIVGTILLCAAASVAYDAAAAYTGIDTRELGASTFLHTIGHRAFPSWFATVFAASGSAWLAVTPFLLIAIVLAATGAIPTLWTALGGRGAVNRTAIAAIRVGGLVLAVGVAALSPSLLSSARLPAAPVSAQLQVGDCIDDTLSAAVGTMAVPSIVSCQTPHKAEIVFVGMTDRAPDTQGYPGDAWLSSHVQELCELPFQSYVGTPVATSSLGREVFFPSEETWTDGDRSVVCAVYDPAQQTIGSLAGSGR